ncbi:ABC transporter ATP-binding protein [Prescottella sp. R16]|uniref:ABC transporter ATP-binding protein n=1 Tax=Prescottella sp. R16 TaxID=3064529 RepID=UPI00272DF3A9|nr:ABC transporter ATP-binding protein [Prescottella sp. R16]
MRLAFDHVTIRRGDHTVIQDVNLVVEPGTVLGLVGPNGSGKSSLLRTVYRAATPERGRIMVGERDLHRLPAREAARSVAAMTQDNPGEFDLTVLDMVLLGRTPHTGGSGADTRRDIDIAAAAIDRVGASDWVTRTFTTLSGGQKQRVLLARALAQQAPVLVLDEPTNHLDVAQRIAVMEAVDSLDVTTVVATHDLDLAVQYCDRVAVLAHGTLRAHGKPTDVLTEPLLRDVFGIDAAFAVHPTTGRTHLLVAGIHRKEPALQ